MEEFYLVLITNLQSNILQDIDTLRLLGQVVTSVVRQLDEREIIAKAFELLSAFDEVVNMGYRENLSLSQVMTFLQMDSHEEKIHDIIQRNKELEAAEERKRRAKELELQNKGGNRNFGQQSFSSFSSNKISTSTPLPSTYEEEVSKFSSPTLSSFKGKGMQLGKKKNGALHALRGSLGTETEMASLVGNTDEVGTLSSRYSNKPTKKQVDEFDNDGIHIAVKEEISAVIERMGKIASSEVKGSLQLRIADPALTQIQIIVSADGPNSQYRTHPNVDKSAFLKNRVIKLKDSSRGFPANNQELSVLRWQSSNDTSVVPLNFNCWINESGDGQINTVIEYDLNENYIGSLENVVVTIPLENGASVQSSEAIYEQYEDYIEWTIPSIEAGEDTSNGSFEFTASVSTEEALFPMSVEFKVSNVSTSFGQVDVIDVVSSLDEGESVAFKKDFVVVSEKVSIR